MLDLGFSGDHLHRWLQSRLEDDGADLPQVVEDAAKMCAAAPVDYAVLVPLRAAPPATGNNDGPLHYLDQPEAAAWLDRAGAQGVPQRPAGAWVISVAARDPHAAVHQVAELVARIRARVAVGIKRSGSVQPVGYAWVAGKPDRFALQDPRRRLLIPALDRQGLVYSVRPRAGSAFDDALELAAQMQEGSAGAAVAGAWAAVEALLRGPDDRPATVAADRMAAIVACSFPRAELTHLTHVYRDNHDALGQRLSEASRMRDQVALLEQAIRGDRLESPQEPGDRAALARVQGMLGDGKTLDRVRGYVAQALRRLYNQRNLVMHAGYLRSVGLRPALRTVPPILSAGLDRVAHALFAESHAPDEGSQAAFALFARAKVELELLGTTGAADLGLLLEREALR